MRYCFARKNFATVRAGAFMDTPFAEEILQMVPTWAFGAEYARQSMFGPLKLAVQWCQVTGVTGYLSVGFEF